MAKQGAERKQRRASQYIALHNPDDGDTWRKVAACDSIKAATDAADEHAQEGTYMIVCVRDRWAAQHVQSVRKIRK